MSGDAPNKQATESLVDRMKRLDSVLPPEGQPYHVLEAQNEAGARAGLWMAGPKGGIPVFQSRETATDALRFVPSPQALGHDAAAVRWAVHTLSDDEFRTLFLNPGLTLFVVHAMNDAGIEAQPL
ncbi:hypothetical protein [Myxococcus sp. AS-1-15]|jgi:hypothetical protein|uniref:hypothetical protein n=1 Tax=Myxococcus sp. AS-1-15 TaxID=2874600 RepID=UPI001CBC2159|nr:hypothetical protein [Myxococcus sp. AS-1-15]MBZ4400734.1 hypothetical protein [Myxococcus sp. AS-1-15]